MAVNDHRGGDVAMPQPLGDDPGVNAMIDEQCGSGMAQIVEADVAQVVLLDEGAEPQVGALMVERRSVCMAEDKVVFIASLVLPASPSITELSRYLARWA
jgi:hypothetical protein